MTAKARRGAVIFLGLVCLLLAIPAVLTWRTVRQEHLNLALIEAAKHSDDKAAIRLLEQGADPNCREKATVALPPWFMLLDLIRGIRPKERSDAMTPLAYAAGGNVLTIQHMGKSTGWTFGPGHEWDNTALVGALLAHGARINEIGTPSPGSHGPPPFTPLYYSLESGRPAIMRLLLACGADVNARVPWFVQTPLMCASAKRNVDAVKLLLAYHADVNLETDGGRTAIDFANLYPTAPPELQQRAREVIRLLKAAGAKPSLDPQ